MYAAIDKVVSKLDRQVIKHKEKIQSHKTEKMDSLIEETVPSEEEYN